MEGIEPEKNGKLHIKQINISIMKYIFKDKKKCMKSEFEKMNDERHEIPRKSEGCTEYVVESIFVRVVESEFALIRDMFLKRA